MKVSQTGRVEEFDAHRPFQKQQSYRQHFSVQLQANFGNKSTPSFVNYIVMTVSLQPKDQYIFKALVKT
jgi:hypothetical protein